NAAGRLRRPSRAMRDRKSVPHSSEKEHRSPYDQTRGGGPGYPIPARRQLLHRHQDGQKSHPNQIHRAHREARQHQRPATAYAVGAVNGSETKAAAGLVIPASQEISKRVPAMSETVAAEG